MSEPEKPVASPSSPMLTIGVRLWLGLFVYGILNLPIWLLAYALTDRPIGSTDLWGAVIFFAVVLVVAVFGALVFRWRMFAAGLLAGYALMTIVSGGVCTGFNVGPGQFQQLSDGPLFYLAVLLLSLVGLVILSIVESRRAKIGVK
jgi:hypothetical protein